MRLSTLIELSTDTDIIVKDKATDETINLFAIGDSFTMCDVVELSAHNNLIVAYIDIEDKTAVFNKEEIITINMWEKIFSSCNSWGFSYESYEWIISGIDAPCGGYAFTTKAEMLETMEADIKEVLYNEYRNGTIKDFVNDFDL